MLNEYTSHQNVNSIANLDFYESDNPKNYTNYNLSLIITNKQELVCRFMALGFSMSTACIMAGYDKSNLAQTVERLNRSRFIHARVKQIENGDYKGIEPCRELILLELRRIAELATKSGKYNEAIKAIELIGHDLGMFGIKREQTAEKIITIIIKDSYNVDSVTGKCVVSQCIIKDAENMAMRAEDAGPVEIVEDTIESLIEPAENCLAKYVKE